MLQPAGILKNTSTGRFHPIIFRQGPAPSSSENDDVQRFKSQGHHTEGFDTVEEATEFLEENSSQLWNSNIVWDWDGKEIPAMTWWFSMSALTPKTN